MAIITISRHFGAGGKTLGEEIAKKMGYTFLDDVILQEVAKKAKVSNEWVEGLEKEAGGRVSKFIANFISRSFIEKFVGEDKGYIDEDIYVELLHEIIRKFADKDNVVFLGRGGQYILKDYPNAYHILLVAEYKDRVKFMMDHYKLSLEKAESVVTSEDKRRLNLYKKFHKEDYDSPLLYNMVINTSRISMDKAIKMVCFMVECHLECVST
ncbi:MAG: cytidylate kinase-like family protein [Desulfobacterales bacterium]|nr:cytidylate kinase-like family protein [Desulfobacterales bacterium]